MKLKICGLRNKENVREIAETIAPDYAGFIFYEKSPRYINDEAMLQLMDILPAETKKVGVFVDENENIIAEKANRYKLDYLQLHGNESANLCETLSNKGYKIIKAFSITPQFDFDLLLDYKPYVRFFLFDTKGEYLGGNGYSFDWEILNSYDQKVPFFLSGGISLENVEEVRKFAHLNIHALDVNSKFEIFPGLKEVTKLKKLKTLLEAINTNQS